MLNFLSSLAAFLRLAIIALGEHIQVLAGLANDHKPACGPAFQLRPVA